MRPLVGHTLSAVCVCVCARARAYGGGKRQYLYFGTRTCLSIYTFAPAAASVLVLMYYVFTCNDLLHRPNLAVVFWNLKFSVLLRRLERLQKKKIVTG